MTPEWKFWSRCLLRAWVRQDVFSWWRNLCVMVEWSLKIVPALEWRLGIEVPSPTLSWRWSPYGLCPAAAQAPSVRAELGWAGVADMLPYAGTRQGSCKPCGKLDGRTDAAENTFPLPAWLAPAGQSPLLALGGGIWMLVQGSGWERAGWERVGSRLGWKQKTIVVTAWLWKIEDTRTLRCVLQHMVECTVLAQAWQLDVEVVWRLGPELALSRGRARVVFIIKLPAAMHQPCVFRLVFWEEFSVSVLGCAIQSSGACEYCARSSDKYLAKYLWHYGMKCRKNCTIMLRVLPAFCKAALWYDHEFLHLCYSESAGTR